MYNIYMLCQAMYWVYLEMSLCLCQVTSDYTIAGASDIHPH